MKKSKEKRKSLLKEFGEFLNKGNIVDMAVGIIIGAAFKEIVNQLVSSIIMPIFGLIIKVDFTTLKSVVGDPPVEILWGTFIQAVIDFLLIALVIFFAIKALAGLRKGFEKAKEAIEDKIDGESDEKPEETAEAVAEVADATVTDASATVNAPETSKK